MKLILASASSRRKELLGRITENFVTIVSDFDEENVPYKGSCESYVISLAKGKALNVAEKLKEESLVIGCDTIVTLDDKVLGKPKDKEQAFEMLSSLSGRGHRVYSGICIVNSKTGEIKSDFMCTEVKFSELSQEDILNYIESGDPFDKAGAYGIQGYAGVFVEGIKGCYYNVVGLPLNKLKKMLKEIGGNF